IDALSGDLHLLLFQPGVLLSPYSVLPCNTPINRTNVVYAPHFYPNFTDYNISGYEPLLQRYLTEATTHQTPVFIGEFGKNWNATNDGNLFLESEYQKTEKETMQLFDNAKISYTRPWFSDDNSKVTDEWNWALIKGTSGLSGIERKFIVDYLARPFPQCTAGTLSSFVFDIDTKDYSMSYTPDTGNTDIFIPRTRHYPWGFKVIHSKGITLKDDPSQFTGLNVLENPGAVDSNKFSWNEASGTLRITEWLTGESVTVEIKPLTETMTLVYPSGPVFEGDLIVSPGTEYVIRNMTYQINGNLTVEKGAKLTVENSTLTVKMRYKCEKNIYINGGSVRISSSTVKSSPEGVIQEAGEILGAQLMLDLKNGTTDFYAENSNLLCRLSLMEKTKALISSSTVSFIYWMPTSDFEIYKSTIGIFVFNLSDTAKETLSFNNLKKDSETNFTMTTSSGQVIISGTRMISEWQFCLHYSLNKSITISNSDIGTIWTRIPPTDNRITISNLPNGFVQDFSLKQKIQGLTLEGDVHLINTTLQCFKPELLSTKAEIINSYAMFHPYGEADTIVRDSYLIYLNHYGSKRTEIINTTVFGTLQLIDKPGYHETINGRVVGEGGYFDIIFSSTTIDAPQIVVACNTGTISGTVYFKSPKELSNIQWVRGKITRTYPLIVETLEKERLKNVNVYLKESGTTLWTGMTDTNGETSFSIMFTSNNYNHTYELAVEKSTSTRNINFLTDTPIRVDAKISPFSFFHDTTTITKEIEVSQGRIKIEIPAGTVEKDYYILTSTSPQNTEIETANQKDNLDKNLDRLPGTMIEINLKDTSGVSITGTLKKEATISIPYADNDNNGIVDNTSPAINEKTLSIYHLENNTWQKISASYVDIEQNIVRVNINRFSVFILMGSPSAQNLNDAFAYPVPCGQGCSRIIFRRLTSEAKIKIYTITAELVRELVNYGGDDTEEWDLKNESGENVASGIYIYLISDNTGSKKGKIAIIK
ncbi:MAG TPA: hypothetical protein DHV62_06735, partial [Elusimicrobia bacterium]|nr:hypothetical protein [Elusimicrobiota bacterium]